MSEGRVVTAQAEPSVPDSSSDRGAPSILEKCLQMGSLRRVRSRIGTAEDIKSIRRLGMVYACLGMALLAVSAVGLLWVHSA